MKTVTETKDLIGQAEALLTEAKAILGNSESTAEERERVPEMIEEAKSLKAQAQLMTEIDAEGAAIAAQQAADAQSADEAKQKLPKPGAFKSWGNFLQACWQAGTGRKFDERLVFVEDNGDKEIYHDRKDMVESIGASGGFLVPTEHDTNIRAVAAENSLVRSRATIIRMMRRQITIPVLDQTGSTAGVPHWFGGMYAQWTEEAQEKDEQDPEWRQISLTAHKLVMYTRASDELVDDSALALGDFLAGPMGFGGAIGWEEDYTFLQGSGAGQPRGVVTAPCTIVVPRASANHITYPDLANMMGEFLQSGRGVWFASISALPELLQLNGPAGNPSYLWGSAKDGVPTTLLGLPIFFTEKLPALGTQGDVLLADWQYYLIGDRQAITIESTKYDRWRYDQTSWRAVHRVDGQPWLSAPITYQDGVHQCSPFVVLGDKTT